MPVDPRNPQRITGGRLSMSRRPPGTSFYSGGVARCRRGSTEIAGAPLCRGHSLRPLIDRPATHSRYRRVRVPTSISRHSASACRLASPPFPESPICRPLLPPIPAKSGYALNAGIYPFKRLGALSVTDRSSKFSTRTLKMEKTYRKE